MELRKPAFKMLQTVEDKLSGFSGSIMSITYYQNGAIHYGLGPRSLDDKGGVREWEFFDEKRLKLCEKQIPLEMELTEFNPKFKFFDILKDSVSGFKGVVLAIANFATGCTQYALGATELKDNTAPEKMTFIDESILDYVSKLNREKPKGKPKSGPDYSMRQK